MTIKSHRWSSANQQMTSPGGPACSAWLNLTRVDWISRVERQLDFPASDN